jgi:hypothetical protein
MEGIYYKMTHPITEIVAGPRMYPIMVGFGCCVLFGTVPKFIAASDIDAFYQSRNQLYTAAIHQIDTFWKRKSKKSQQ